jgi:hypothetical protein
MKRVIIFILRLIDLMAVFCAIWSVWFLAGKISGIFLGLWILVAVPAMLTLIFSGTSVIGSLIYKS